MAGGPCRAPPAGTSRWRLAGLLLAATCLVTSGAAGEASPRRFGLDDLLRLEGYGTAAIDPAGRWLVWEQLRPYEENTDFSFRTYAFAKSGHQLWRLDLAGETPPERLPGLDPDPHSYQLGFSPGGDFLGVMQYSFGALSLGAYDPETEHLARFAPVPAFGRAGEHNPVWSSAHELIYAALPDGDVPVDTSIRAGTAKWLIQAWRAAWDGSAVTALEVRTPAEQIAEGQAPGALVLADARTGETEILAEGLFADLRLSPDGRWLAALAVEDARPLAAEAGEVADPRRYRLAVIDLETRQVRRPLCALEVAPYSAAWNFDGTRLAVFAWPDGQGIAEGQFHVVDLASGVTAPYPHTGLDLASERERGWLQRPERAMFLGEDLAVFARRVPEDEDGAWQFTFRETRPSGLAKADWYALAAHGGPRNLTASIRNVSAIPVHAGDGHVTVWSPDGVFRLHADGLTETLARAMSGHLRYAAPGTFATRAAVIRPDFAAEALFTDHSEAGERLLVVDLEAGGDRTWSIDLAPGGSAPLAASAAGGVLAYRREDGPASALGLARRGEPGVGRQISLINGSLRALEFGTWASVRYAAGSDGAAPLEACVLLPPDFDRAAPPPLVIDVYPNASARCAREGPRLAYPDPHSPYVWASKGYAYARVATPRALIRTEEGPIAGIDEVVEAGALAIAGAGLADPDRMILTGFSQGGVSSLYVAAHTRLFRAVIAKNGWANLLSHYFGPMGIQAFAGPEYLGADAVRYDPAVGTDFAIGRSPFEDPDIYLRASPVFLAPEIGVPVLLIHSDMDTMALSEFDQMFSALAKAGKAARYVRYIGEGHGPSSPANIRDMWARQLAFLEEHGLAP